MGYQQGSLLKEEITINRRAFKHFFEEKGISFDDLQNLWNKQEKYVPKEIIDFIQGMADALDLQFQDIASSWMIEGCFYSKCCSMSAWGDATTNGKLIQIRSMEFPLDIVDPITGKYVQEHPVIIFAKPESGHDFIYPSLAGYVIEGGINDKGISIANMWSPNKDHNDYGQPMGLRLFEVLYRADTAEEAIEILTSSRTYGYNFIVSDSKVPIGYAVETTANNVYYGTWDDPTESNRPFKEIKNVVRRTNCFLNSETAAAQRSKYRPQHLRNIIEGNKEGIPWVYVWHQFNSLSSGIKRNLGDLDVETAMNMLRNMYKGDYDRVWRYLLRKTPEEVWWHWSACPETGEMLISFANKEYSGQYTSFYHLNFLKIIEEENFEKYVELIK